MTVERIAIKTLYRFWIQEEDDEKPYIHTETKSVTIAKNLYNTYQTWDTIYFKVELIHVIEETENVTNLIHLRSILKTD